MKRFFVLGDPIDHSRSPAMHNAAFKALGIDAHYDRKCVREGELKDVLDVFFRAGDVLGLNLTAPLKAEGARLCREHFELDGLSDRLDAVNTLVRTASGWRGHNTDAAGFVKSMSSKRFEKALVIGGGGAARAVIAGLANFRSGDFTDDRDVAGENAKLTIALRQGGQSWASRGELSALGQSAKVIALNEVSAALSSCEHALVVNATSAHGAREVALAEQVFEGVKSLSGALVVDLRYGHTSALLHQAERLGAGTQDGLPMLIEQGALAFELWTNAHFGAQTAPREIMKAATG